MEMSQTSQIHVLVGHCHVFAQNLCQYLPEGKEFGIYPPIPETIDLVIFIFLYLGPAHTHTQVCDQLKANVGLLRKHVSQTCCHLNDDKLVLSPLLSSQSSPDLDVMHVLLQ